jgi:hypothetical protein
MPFLIKMFYFFILSIHFIFFLVFSIKKRAGKDCAVEVGLDKRFKELLYILGTKLSQRAQRADFFVREKIALTHVKQQQCVLVGTVKRV